MTELIIYILLFLVGFALGYMRGMHKITEFMINNPDKFSEMIQAARKQIAEAKLDDDVANNRETVIDIDREQNQYYAYATNGEFLAQGEDFKTVFERIKKRFPGRSFRINKYNAKLTEEETTRMVKAVFESFGETPPSESSQKSWPLSVLVL